jgi:hypothetical protein
MNRTRYYLATMNFVTRFRMCALRHSINTIVLVALSTACTDRSSDGDGAPDDARTDAIVEREDGVALDAFDATVFVDASDVTVFVDASDATVFVDASDVTVPTCTISPARCPSTRDPALVPTVRTSAELVAAVNSGTNGATIILAPGTYELTASLRPRPGMTIRGAGAGVTIVRNAAAWAPGIAGLDADEGAQLNALRCDAYLIHLPRDGADVTITDLTLTGPTLHGGICGIAQQRFTLARVEFRTFLWSGLRAFILSNARIFDNRFIDAGGRNRITEGSSGGGLFLTYVSQTEIFNNRFEITPAHPGDYYGIKGREAREVHIHHNTIGTFFSIELPFENDWLVEIDHNRLDGAVSFPKYGGGTVSTGRFGFHVHHNYFSTSYAFEYQRNNVEIDHNLFDFRTDQDGGNLISCFDPVPADPGGTRMHDNLISNPGRGLYWSEGVYNNFQFFNNHVRARTTMTPRTEGLFDFRPARNGATTQWSTIALRDNIFELEGTARQLMRNSESYAAVIENNALTNVSDSSRFANRTTGAPRGPIDPLRFRLGAYDEWTIDQWQLSRTPCGCR